MELDALKSAWQQLDQRLDRQSALGRHLFADLKQQRARRGLRSLHAGQVLQILFGIALTLWAGSFVFEHRDVMHLFAAGLALQFYGVLTVAFAAMAIARAARIDYAAPVLVIQKQLAHLRAFYVRTNVGLGLAWWVLWMPFTMMAFAEADIDLLAAAPAVLGSGAAMSVAGLLVTLLFARWAFDPRHPQRARAVRENMTGASLLRAQRQLDEIARFEAGEDAVPTG